MIDESIDSIFIFEYLMNVIGTLIIRCFLTLLNLAYDLSSIGHLSRKLDLKMTLKLIKYSLL
jgi:hypothetical protein